MHRVYVEPAQAQNSTLHLNDSESHHLTHVLRARAGERVVGLDGAGHEFLCEIASLGRGEAQLKVLQRQSVPALPFQITLLQAVMRAKTMDLIIQKATELGAYRIVPILSERSVSQIEEDATAAKLEKWRTTAIESIKQCGSHWLPRFEAPQTPQKVLGTNERYDLPLIASLQPGARHPRDYFRTFAAEQARQPKSVCVWVGPEGDFTPAEINAVRQAGALPITLGPLILRSETAAIYCLSILNYELQAPK